MLQSRLSHLLSQQLVTSVFRELWFTLPPEGVDQREALIRRVTNITAVVSGAYITTENILMIIAGGKPELCCGMARHGMLSERVGSMHAHICMHYVCASLVQNAVWTCCAYVEKCEKGFVWSDWRQKRESQGWGHRQGSASSYEEVRWSLSRSSLAVRCAGVSAFRFPIIGVLGLVAITTALFTTTHMSVAAWARATYQY